LRIASASPRAELPTEGAKLAAQRLSELGRRALCDPLEVVDLEDRVREDLRGAVVHVAVEPLALGLETFQHALRDIERLTVAVWLWLDAGSEQVRDARLDVLHDELELLQAAIGALRRFVHRDVARSARLALRHALICARELLDLLARSTNVAPQRVDQCIELRFEVVRIFDETRLWTRRPSIWTRTGHSGDHRVSARSLEQHRARILGHHPPTPLPEG
jgi:hypothetical protein